MTNPNRFIAVTVSEVGLLLGSLALGGGAFTVSNARQKVVPYPRLSFRLHETATNGDDDIQECSLDDEDAESCLSSTGYYKVDESSFVTVSEVFVAEVETLRDRFPSYETVDDDGNNKGSKNVIRFNKRKSASQLSEATENSHAANMEYNDLISERELVLVDTIRKPGMKSISRAFHRAGPRKNLHFCPDSVNAAIVTCGGLCPGLNNVIRELVHSLYYLYGASKVYGIMGGTYILVQFAISTRTCVCAMTGLPLSTSNTPLTSLS